MSAKARDPRRGSSPADTASLTDDALSETLERLDVADTLEDLRRHIDALIGQLAEQTPEAEPAGAPEQLGSGPLAGQIDSLGRKVEGASDMLAELADLLESQTERIETIEHQLGDPDATKPAGQPPVPEPVETPRDDRHALSEQREIEMERRLAALEDAIARLVGEHAPASEVAALRTDLEHSLSRIAGSVERFEHAVAELSADAGRRDGRLGALEQRVVALGDAVSAQAAAQADAQAAAAVAIAPRPPLQLHAGGDVGVAATAEPASPPPPPPPAEPVAAPSPAQPELEVMDSAAVRRLEELVEREVRLQQEFSPGAASVEPESRRGRPSVMVVDDSADARTVLSIFLSKTGYQVVTASSAEDCLAKLRHHRIDVLILDATMPGGSGGHVCHVLRTDPAYAALRNVAIIVYTAYPDETPRSVAEQWGADDYVIKGGDMLPLVTALVRHTKGQAPASP